MKERTLSERFLSRFKILGYPYKSSIVNALQQTTCRVPNGNTLGRKLKKILSREIVLPKEMRDHLILFSNQDTIITELCNILMTPEEDEVKMKLKKSASNFLERINDSEEITLRQIPSLSDYDELTKMWINCVLKKEMAISRKDIDKLVEEAIAIEKRMIKLTTSKDESFIKKAFSSRYTPDFLSEELIEVAQELSK